MSKDWDKELAKVDKQMASMSDDALLGPIPVQLPGKPGPTAKGAAGGTGSTPRGPNDAKPSPPTSPPAGGGTSTFGVYARLTLSVALGVAMVVWPYPARCGAGLAAYLAAVVVVVASGVWSSVWTWRHRAAHAHTLSLLIVLWGLVLGSTEVLPRVGYARADPQHPAGWSCAAPAAVKPPTIK